MTYWKLNKGTVTYKEPTNYNGIGTTTVFNDLYETTADGNMPINTNDNPLYPLSLKTYLDWVQITKEEYEVGTKIIPEASQGKSVLDDAMIIDLIDQLDLIMLFNYTDFPQGTTLNLMSMRKLESFDLLVGDKDIFTNFNLATQMQYYKTVESHKADNSGVIEKLITRIDKGLQDLQVINPDGDFSPQFEKILNFHKTPASTTRTLALAHLALTHRKLNK